MAGNYLNDSNKQATARPKITIEDGRESCILEYTGRYSTLLKMITGPAKIYIIGEVSKQLPDCTLSAINLEGEEAGVGLLTLTYSYQSPTGGGSAPSTPKPEDLLPESYQLTFSQYEVPIAVALAEDTDNGGDDSYGGGGFLAWQAQPPEERVGHKFKDRNGVQHDLGTNAKKWAKLVDQGLEAVVKFAPTVSKTSQLLEEPKIGGCGKRSTPPQFASTAKDWLKVGEDISFANGVYNYTESWRGENKWDPTIYPAG